MDQNPLFLLLALVVIMCLVVVACPRGVGFISERAKKKVHWADDVIFNGT